jgi:hypothetical protein
LTVQNCSVILYLLSCQHFKGKMLPSEDEKIGCQNDLLVILFLTAETYLFRIFKKSSLFWANFRILLNWINCYKKNMPACHHRNGTTTLKQSIVIKKQLIFHNFDLKYVGIFCLIPKLKVNYYYLIRRSPVFFCSFYIQ